MRRRVDPALVVVLAGVCAALHVGKLPPAIPLLREMLGVSLVQAGFLLSLVQFAGMTLGLAVGLAADGWGLKRSMVLGQCLLALSSAMGGAARSAESLLAWRVVEGLGLLLATMPAPGLIRQLVPPARLSGVLGLWGAYMPGGAAAALLCGPPLMAALGWSVWWWLLSALSLGMAVWLSRVIPRQEQVTPSADLEPQSWRTRLRRTLTARGPWLVALAFAMYSGQWLAVVGFLPSVYAQSGMAAALGGALTAMAALVNITGNIAAGRLLQRGWQPPALLWIGFATMGLMAIVAFANVPSEPLPPALRYAAVLLFSMVGGVIPGTLFSLAVSLAPTPRTVSTTVGWMHQCSSIGQFATPPAVAWMAAQLHGWHGTWYVTGSCAVLGALVTALIARELGSRAVATGEAGKISASQQPGMSERS